MARCFVLGLSSLLEWNNPKVSFTIERAGRRSQFNHDPVLHNRRSYALCDSLAPCVDDFNSSTCSEVLLAACESLNEGPIYLYDLSNGTEGVARQPTFSLYWPVYPVSVGQCRYLACRHLNFLSRIGLYIYFPHSFVEGQDLTGQRVGLSLPVCPLHGVIAG